MNKQTLKFKGRGGKVKTYVFDIEFEEEEDGRWSAVIPGCMFRSYIVFPPSIIPVMVGGM